jgi:uncharacterized protein
MSNTTAANKKLVMDVFERWSRGAGSIVDILANDLSWEVVGESAVAGVYTRDEFVNGVLAEIGKRFTAHGPVRPTRIRAAIAEADWVVVLWDGVGTTNANTEYANTYAWCMVLRDGRVVRATAYFDSIAFDRMWAVPPATA